MKGSGGHKVQLVGRGSASELGRVVSVSESPGKRREVCVGGQRSCLRRVKQPPEVPHLAATCLTQGPYTSGRPFCHLPLKVAHHKITGFSKTPSPIPHLKNSTRHKFKYEVWSRAAPNVS